MKQITTADLHNEGEVFQEKDYDPNEVYDGFSTISGETTEDQFRAFDEALKEQCLELEVVADPPGDEQLFRVVKR